MGSSRSASNGIITPGSRQQYPYPCNVNAASFLSIKLNGKGNYTRWQEQMMCIVESHDMLGFIDGTLLNPWNSSAAANCNSDKEEAIIEAKFREWKRSEALMKGWILGSLSEDVMDTVVGLPYITTAHDVWIKLRKTYSNTFRPPASTTNGHIDQAEYLPLYRAALSGDWETAKDIFKKNKHPLLRVKLNDDNQSALHVAIGTCKNIKFVENLLNEIYPSSTLPRLLNVRWLNPLHHAAFVGNTKAAELLVAKNKYLLFHADKGKSLPIHRAIFGSHIHTFLYLLKVTKDNINLSNKPGCESPFKGINSAPLLTSVINAGLWDTAYELITEYPDMAKERRGNSIPLKAIAGKLDAYFSGKRYNFYQAFVYSHVPLDLDALNKGPEIHDIENQDTHKANFTPNKWRSFFHPAIKKIYFKLWDAALQYVPHIKKLKQEKETHTKALSVLKRLCENVGKIETFCEIREHYLEAITLAVENDNPEVVEEIIRYFPQAISTKDNDYPLIQLAILNRSERVYNFLVHHVMNDNHLHKVRTDEYSNNLLHLVGQLAPIHKLNLVSGAALQMQRELQWFEEVKTFACPWHEKTKNKKHEIPIMVFRREHKRLRIEGEEWMKKTGDAYTITAALIITIVFAAAITVPGGNDGNNGKPIYSSKPSFIIFAIADAISLFTSTTSLLLFLSILTARYAEEDFLYKLPKRLILGLAMLFLSITSMMVAFSATLYLMFGQGKAWIVIPIYIHISMSSNCFLRHITITIAGGSHFFYIRSWNFY